MSRYVKRPVVIEAVAWDRGHPHAKVVMPSAGSDYGIIRTLGGLMRVDEGDYIVTGSRGEHYPVKADVFLEAHEAVIPTKCRDK